MNPCYVMMGIYVIGASFLWLYLGWKKAKDGVIICGIGFFAFGLLSLIH